MTDNERHVRPIVVAGIVLLAAVMTVAFWGRDIKPQPPEPAHGPSTERARIADINARLYRIEDDIRRIRELLEQRKSK